MKRLTLSLVLVVVSAVIGLGWGIDQWYNAQLADTEDPAVSAYKNIGRELAVLIDQNGASPEWQHWFGISEFHPYLSPYADFPLPADVKVSFESGEPLLLESGNQLSLHYYLASQQQVFSLTLPNAFQHEMQNPLRWILTLLFYGGVILVVLIWLYPLLQRLALLRRTAQAFGAGNLQVRIAPDKRSYILAIEREFNRMAQHIEQLIADNKLLSSGLSHDLRTPLARLRFGLDVLEEANLSPAQQQNLAHLNRDLIAMESLVEALLNYARFEQAAIAFTPQKIHLQEFLTHLVHDFYGDKIALAINLPIATGSIQADPEYLTMLVHNLLQNALHYGAGHVQLSLVQQRGQVQLQVDDNGPGIPLAERAKVLKPFYRASYNLDTETATIYRGHGLGLAIVERIARWHKAELMLSDSASLGGLKVSLLFPAAN